MPHSESNRFIGRYAYIILPQGKSLDINYIHNQAMYTGTTTNLDYGGPNSSRRFFRNQGVGSWEMNLAAFLVDLDTNIWKPRPETWYRYTPSTAEGIAFQNASALLSYRLGGTRDNLLTGFGALTNRPTTSGGTAGSILWDTDYVDYLSDGPLVHFDQWYTHTAPIRTGQLADNDQQNKYWHGAEKVDRTREFPDIQHYFNLPGGQTLDFARRFTNAVSFPRTNTHSRYAYYRMLRQMGTDSTPALKGKIHLNFTNEPGTLSTNLRPWVSTNGPAYVQRPLLQSLDSNGVARLQVSTLTNFFLIAADAMLRASLVTNVFLDDFGAWRTNYTVGGSYFSDPALNARPDQPRKAVNMPGATGYFGHEHPDFSHTQWRRSTIDHRYVTNAEYNAALHRIFQLSANIYDNMTNRSDSAGTSEPFFPTVFRPLFYRTPTNITIIGWEHQENANFAARTNNWFKARDFFASGPGSSGLMTNVNIFGQPWVVGAKKGWPNFNEFSIESFIQITRKLGIFKEAPGIAVTTNLVDLGRHTQQIFMLGISNSFGIEAWNSYPKALSRRIRLETEVQSEFGLFRTNNLNVPLLYVTNAVTAGNYTINPGNWAGREPNDTPFPLIYSLLPNGTNGLNSDYRVPIYGMTPFLRDSEYSPTAPQPFFIKPALFHALNILPDLRLVITNRIRYVAIDTGENRVIDFVSLDNLITSVNLSDLMQGDTNNVGSSLALGNKLDEVFEPGQLWSQEVLDPASGLTRGMLKQIQLSRGEFPTGFGENQWRTYASAQSRMSETNTFKNFMAGNPVNQNIDRPWQAPFSPTRRFYLQTAFQADGSFCAL